VLQLLPKNCASQIVQALQQRRKDKKGHAIEEPEKPGTESYRKHREELTRLDKLHMALTELCYAINYCSVITIWEHGFVPREFFTSTLESRLNK
jgi:NCK-associated protein 1